MEISLAFTDGSSDKFWRARTEGATLTTEWGRTGTTGRSKDEDFDTAAEAEEAARAQADVKRRKGYTDAPSGAASPTQPAATSSGRASGSPSSRPTATKTAAQAGSATTKARTKASDKAAIAAFFAAIDSDSLIALPPATRDRYSWSDGRDDAVELAADRGVEPEAWVYWHYQSAERAFDGSGTLVQPLHLHWGGDYDRVRQALAGAPEPYVVTAHGEDQSFQLTRTDLDRLDDRPVPEPSDDKAVHSHYQRLVSKDELSDADWAWLNDVLRRGSAKARTVVADRLLGSAHVTDDAIDALLEDWVPVYKHSEMKANPALLLRTLRERQHARYQEVVDGCLAQKGWVFQWAVAEELGERGDADITILRKLATTKSRGYGSMAGNPPAIEAWLARRAALWEQPLVDVALESLRDPAFDDAGRHKIAELACYAASPTPEEDRLVKGAKLLLTRDHLSNEAVDLLGQIVQHAR